MSDRDDELGHLLRSEIPDTGPNYWDNIDAMLQRVEHERSSERPVEEADSRPTLRPVPPLADERADHGDSEPQIEGQVIGIGGATQTISPNRFDDRYLTLVAAAVVLIVGIGAFVAFARNDANTDLLAVDDPTASVTSPSDGGQAVTGDPDNTDETPGQGEGAGGSTDLAGSAWTFAEPGDGPRPLLAPPPSNALSERTVWVKPLVATGQEVADGGETYIEINGLGEDNVWFPVSALRRVADGLPPVATAAMIVRFDETVEGRPYPSLSAEVTTVAGPGSTMFITGLRFAADGVSWALVTGETPYFVDESLLEPVPPENDGPLTRRCYSNGDLAITLDFTADTGTFTGWQIPVGLTGGNESVSAFELGDLPRVSELVTVAGVASDPPAGLYRVSEMSLVGQENGRSTVSTLDWTVTETDVTQPGAVSDVQFAAVACEDVADDVGLVEGVFPFFPDLPIEPVTTTELLTTPGENRACYGGTPEVYIFDLSADGAVANGLNSVTMETYAASRLDAEGATYWVATLVLGDRENGRDTINTTQWDITPEAITQGFSGEEIPAVDCADFAEEIANAEQFLGAAPYPQYPPL